MSDSLGPHGLQNARLPSLSPTPGACSNSCPSSQWCHRTISSSVIPFSSRLQSFPASGSFPISQFFTSGGQTIGPSASASVLPMNIQDWFPLGWTGCISLQWQVKMEWRGIFQNLVLVVSYWFWKGESNRVEMTLRLAAGESAAVGDVPSDWDWPWEERSLFLACNREGGCQWLSPSFLI